MPLKICQGSASPRPLFGLDRLAAHPDAIVLLIEGEKAANAVERGPLAHEFAWASHKVIGMTWARRDKRDRARRFLAAGRPRHHHRARQRPTRRTGGRRALGSPA